MKTFIRNHPATSLTLGFGYCAFLGMLNQYFLLLTHDINALDYVATNDFMLFFLRSIPYLLIALLIHILIWIKDLLFGQNHAPGNTMKERIYNLVTATSLIELVFVLAFALPLYAGMMGYAKGDSIIYDSKQCSDLISSTMRVRVTAHS